MDSIDHYVMELKTKRDAALAVFDGVIAYVTNMREQLTLAVEEVDKQQRLAGVIRARNQAEQERGDKAVAEANAELAKVRKTIDAERKQWEREKESVRRTFDDILAGKKVA
jgi:septal ring factor EnvC (AmiA/AmiB activator)